MSWKLGRSPEEILAIAEGRAGYIDTLTTQGSESPSELEKSTRIGGWLTSTNATTSVTSKWHKGTGGPAGDEHYNLVLHKS